MGKKIIDVNDLVMYLSVITAKPLLRNDVWQRYGYGKRPICRMMQSISGGVCNDILSLKPWELNDYVIYI